MSNCFFSSQIRNLSPLYAIIRTADTYGIIISLACQLDYDNQIIELMDVGTHALHQYK